MTRGSHDSQVSSSWLPALLQRRREVGQKLLTCESWAPRVIKHYQIVSAGPRGKVNQFLLEEIVVRKLGYVGLYAVQCLVVASSLLQRLPFNTGNDSNRELFCASARALAARK